MHELSGRSGAVATDMAVYSEHIWRGHAPATHCAYCGTRWPSLDRAKKLLEAREKHIPGCRMKHGDKKRQIQYREPNIISEEQQDELKKVKEIKDIERKLETLYTACGLPLPETYRESNPAHPRRHIQTNLDHSL